MACYENLKILFRLLINSGNFISSWTTQEWHLNKKALVTIPFIGRHPAYDSRNPAHAANRSHRLFLAVGRARSFLARRSRPFPRDPLTRSTWSSSKIWPLELSGIRPFDKLEYGANHISESRVKILIALLVGRREKNGIEQTHSRVVTTLITWQTRPGTWQFVIDATLSWQSNALAPAATSADVPPSRLPQRSPKWAEVALAEGLRRGSCC